MPIASKLYFKLRSLQIELVWNSTWFPPNPT